MSANCPVVYSRIKLKEPGLAPPSPLYHLAPVGVGTPYVESLLSYVSRLAAEYCITTYTLLKEEIAPIVNKSYMMDYNHNNTLGHHFKSTSLVGTGIMARDMVKALEMLTRRPDLRFTTMLSWADVVRPSGMLQLKRVWCPQCYESQHSSGGVVYDPLIWMFQEVKVCLKHKSILCSQCPYCFRQLPWLQMRSRPGHCSTCHSWLGNNEPKEEEHLNLTEADWEYQNWLYATVGELLEQAPRLSALPSRKNYAHAVTALIADVAGGNITAFASKVQVHVGTISQWKSMAHAPSFNLISQVCFRCKVSLFDTLNGIVPPEDGAPQKVKRTFKPRPYKKRTREEWKQIESDLRSILKNETPPPSLRQVARRFETTIITLHTRVPKESRAIALIHVTYRRELLNKKIREVELKLEAIKEGREDLPLSVAQFCESCNCNWGWVRYHLPEQCRSLVDMIRDRSKLRHDKRKEHLRNEVRRIALELYKKGVYPSFPKVASLMEKPSRMSSAVARNTLRETQRELGVRSIHRAAKGNSQLV